jgi:hypothetical protein
MSKIKLDITEGKIIKKFKVKNSNKKEPRKSIIDIKISNDYSVHLYEGKKEEGKDFIVTYIDKYTKKEPRQLSHLHWVVDILLKMKAEKELTKELIREFQKNREICYPVEDNSKESLIKITEDCITISDISHYENLNEHGIYDVSFLSVILPLLMVQELTNYKDKNPKMINNIFKELLEDEDNFDLYTIISKAKYS